MRACFIILLAALALLLGSVAAESFAEGESPKPAYELVMPASLQLPLGGSQDLALAIRPAEGYRVDGNGPMQIDLSPPGTGHISFKKRKLRRKDAVDPQSGAPRFEVAVEGKSAGRVSVGIQYRFWLCRSQICLPIRGKAALPVEVLAPATDAGPADAAPGAP